MPVRVAQPLDLLDHGRGRTVQDDVAVERIVVALAGRAAIRHRAQITRCMTAGEVLEVAHHAGLALALRLGVGLGQIGPAHHVGMAARRIGAQRHRRLFEMRTIRGGLAAQFLERCPARQHQAASHPARDRDRPIGRTGEEDRRIGLLHGMRKNLVAAIDLIVEVLALVIDALLLQQLEQQRQRLLLHVAAVVELEPEAVELVLAIARAEAEHEAPVAQNVEERGVLGDAHRIAERQRHNRGADLDALGQRR